MSAVSASPPRAAPAKYATPLGTRWAKEKAQAGGSHAFELPTDPSRIGPWILGECIGKGASGRVKIAKHHTTGQLAAVKILPVAPLHSSRNSVATDQAKYDKQRLGIDREITMMKLMNHPNIMRIYDVYEGEKELFLVLEYVEGGELFDFLVNRGRLPPLEALVYFKQIVYGLNYAHTFSIIHRDLKPENILIHTLDPPLIKIADWGMAAFAPPSRQLETSCGSPHYASPEIVNGEKYEGTATDIWSCGVILFALLTGRLPFDDKNVRTLLNKVRSGKFDMPAWIDPLARDLISRMLVVNVRQRITIPEILAHPWLLSPNPSPASSVPYAAITHTPPLPPSPSTLDMPIPSPAHIDPELLCSLRIIWGRHADPSGECIIRDLCSPAGEGTLAKAFYFLLGKYRDGVMSERTHVDDGVFRFRQECETAFGEPQSQECKTLVKPYIKRASTLPTPPGYSHSNQHQPPGLHARVSAKPARLAPPSHGLVAPPMRRCDATSGSSSRERSPSPAGPREIGHSAPAKRKPSFSRAEHLSTKYAAPVYAAEPAVSHVSRPPRPAGPRRGYTYSYHPRAEESSVAFPRQAHSTKEGMMPLRSRSQTTTANLVANVVPLASPILSMPPVVPPQSSNAELQQFMEEISHRVNGFAQEQRQTLTEPRTADGARRVSARYRDKENQGVNEGEAQQGGRGQRAGLGLGEKEIGNTVSLYTVVEGDNGGKKVKTRPPVLDLSLNKAIVDDCLASPIVLSPPINHNNDGTYLFLNRSPGSRDSRLARFSAQGNPSTASRLMTVTSPVVGEFKGWFSNLFNWKTHNPNSGSLDYFSQGSSSADVLYSPLDVVQTRVEVERYLEDELGIAVEGMSNKAGGISSATQTRVQSSVDQESWRVLRCRVEDINGRSKSLGLKSVRFRVEFSPLDTQTRASSYGTRSSTLLSPDLLVTPKANHSATMSSQSGSDFSAQPSEYVTAVILVQEKGSTSSFKAIWRLLRERYPAQIRASKTIGPGHYANPLAVDGGIY